MVASSEGNPSSASKPSSISSTLLEQVRARQPEAWQRLVELYGPVIYHWCRQMGVSNADAADVVQEVFCAVSKQVEQFRHGSPGDSFGAWLRTITHHKVCDVFRLREKRPDAEGGTKAYRQLLNLPETFEESSLSELREPDSRFPRRLLDLVRAEFENRTWEIFWRIAVEGQTPAEVAAATGVSLSAVYKAKSRVLRRLRQEVKDLQE